jgi:hypothetical protein
MTQFDECPIGTRYGQELKELRNRIEKLETGHESFNEKVWLELTSLRKEISDVKGDFMKQVIELKDIFTSEISQLKIEYLDVLARRVPAWVTVVISILAGTVGALLGVVFK